MLRALCDETHPCWRSTRCNYVGEGLVRLRVGLNWCFRIRRRRVNAAPYRLRQAAHALVHVSFLVCSSPFMLIFIVDVIVFFEGKRIASDELKPSG